MPPPKKPDDRIKAPPVDDALAPRIFVVVDGKKLPRPALQTFFAEAQTPKRHTTSAVAETCACQPVTGVYCSCNKVCTCVPACSCVGHSRCSCVGYSSSSSGRGYSGGGGGCRCAPVH